MKKRRGRLGMTFATYLQKVYVNFAEVKRHLSITHKQAWGFALGLHYLCSGTSA